MKIIMISVDQSVLTPHSDMQKRLLEYGKIVEEIYVLVYSETGRHSTKIGEHIYIIPTNSRSKLLFIIDGFFIAMRKFSDFIAHDTVITTQDPFETGLLGYLIKKILGFGLNIQIHTDVLSKYFRFENPLNFMRYLFARYFLLGKADSLRVVSRRIADSLKGIFSTSKIITIPIFSPKIESTSLPKKHLKFTLLSLSRLEKVKNIIGLIQAIEKIIILHTDIHLNIVGRGSQESFLKEYVRKKNLSEYITFYPWTESAEKYYNSSDLFIINSFYEGWGLTAIEAGIHKIPVIMTNTGCAGDFIINNYNGIVIEPGRQEELESAIIKAYTDTTLYESMKVHHKDQLEKLASKEETLELYLSSWKYALSSTHEK